MENQKSIFEILHIQLLHVVERYLSWHLCSVSQESCCSLCWRDCSQSWGPQESEVCRFAQLSYFSRVAIETTRVFGIHTLSFVKSLGKRLSWHFGDPKSTSFLIQRLSIAVQRGNAISIHSTFASATDFLLLILLHLHLSVLLFLVPQRVTNSHNSFSLYNLTLCSHTLHFVMLCSHHFFWCFNNY